MKRIHLSIFLLVTIIVLILSACGEAVNSLDGTSWVLRSYRNNQGENVNVLLRSTTTAHFQANIVSGISGCNNYSVSYEVKNNKIQLGQVSTTQKVCVSPPGIMRQEENFLGGLNSAASYKLKPSSLEIIDSQGNTLLAFAKATE